MKPHVCWEYAMAKTSNADAPPKPFDLGLFQSFRRRWIGLITHGGTSLQWTVLLEGLLMLKSVKGICRDGKVELLEPAPEGVEGQVIVTFLASDGVTLDERGIDQQQAADLRHRLAAFAEDWERPEMDIYDAL
jgi:hypothetical protein